MDNDIVPALLETIEQQFDERTYSSQKLKRALKLLSSNEATYLDVNEFAIELGEILADVLKMNITVEVLPNGKMYFNIAERILNSTMKKNHTLISNFAVDVQAQLNQAAGFKLKGKSPELNHDRIEGIINRLANAEDFEEIKWILGDPLVNFSQSVVDDAIKANADFHEKAGLQPEITRRVDGLKACDWCKNLAGTYDYREAPSDIYRRHEKCHCTIDYKPRRK